ncbi:serine hydrolase [Rheinheimera sp. 1928-s]|uniref:serine hydrolase domain-containing protein n=1 Tax=Rheinheimera sp. 1928-s TaxID=3033803 RepID=UPI0026358846|nr:serine hydrolase [Rheinheimera sp. 1928-s]MDF3124439.1 serine hydrolase [Rheinheimera sp. 1928-s]
MLSAVGKWLIQGAVLCCVFSPALAQSTPPQDKIQFHQHNTPDPALPVHRPAAKGLNEQVLHQLLLQLQDKTASGYQQVHSLLLYKSGALVLEQYQKGNNDFINFEQGVKLVKGQQDFVWTADKPHYVASVTKAVTATLTGIALKQTGLTVDATLAQLLPQDAVIKADPLKASISMHQLLSMQAGFVWDEWAGQDLVKLWQQQNFVDYLLQQPNTGPGKSWAYNSALPNLVLKLLQQQLQQPLQPWAKKQLFDKLGFTNYRWDTQPDGVPEGSARLWLTPRDMLKLGMLYLQQGQWQGEQLLPDGWVQQMTSPHAKSPAGDYGYYFWLRQQDGVSYYTAEGDGGQYIAVFPTLDMVLVLTQGNYLQWALYKTQADRIIQQLILSSKVSPDQDRS